MRKQWWLLAALFLVAVPVFAQKITATIRGTVTDPTNAVISGAKVTVTNEGTGLTRSADTTSAGLYSFSDLPVGTYRVEIEYPGFKSEVRSKIALNVADNRAIDVQLQTGAISEVVDVEVAAVAVKTTGADVSGLVTGEEVRELPLNGRNFMQLTFLQPGVSPIAGISSREKGLSGGSDVSVSGGSTTSNLWMVDGANNNDVGSNRTILVYPSVDAIEEFKIQRNNYGAEFGQAGGAQVNLVTRGGTNEWHGSGYWYIRRDGLNSTDFLLKQAGQEKAALKFDDYGGTLGGPIIKDKLHFFYSEEWNKDKRSTVRSSFVPTQAERNGDFSGAGVPGCSEAKPIDPLTGQPFPGNIIPANRISPGGKLMMQNMSLPNTTPSGGGCNNWVAAVKTPVNWRQENARIDWTVTPSTRMMVRYTQDTWTADTNEWGDDPFPVVGSFWNQPGKSLVVQLNKNIGSRMVNSLTFSYSMNKISVTRTGENPELAKQLAEAIPTLFASDIKTKGGDAMPMANWGSMGPYGGGVLWNQAPWLNNEDLFVIKDDYTAVFGKHAIKAGILGSYNKKNEEPSNTSQESVQVNGVTGFVGPNGFINGANTGNTIANWLLEGMAWDTSEQKNNNSVPQRWKDYEGYIADTYKVSPRVTADFGVRVSHLTPPYMANDQMGSFDLATVNPAFGNSNCNGVIYPPGSNPCAAVGIAGGSSGPNRSLLPTKALLVAPRLGFAWDLSGTGKTAVRGGLGLFYARERLSGGLGLGLSPPFSGVSNEKRTLSSNVAVAGAPSVGFGAPGSGFEQKAANAHNWQWNLSVQHEIVRNTVLEVAYVGNKGLDLIGNTNLNEIAPANRRAYSQSGDVSLRPLNGIAGIGDGQMVLWTHNRNSIYHSLQTSLVSRFGRGSQAQVAYTWSKALANTGIGNADSGISTENTYTDSTLPGLDRSRGAVDRTHVFSGSLVLLLPTLENKGAFAKNVFGDWEFTSIVQAATGSPVTVYLGQVPGLSSNGNLSGTGYSGNQRPDRVDGQPCSISNSSNKTQWFNPAAWTINNHVIGTNGNSGRHICDGPSFFQWDAALYKNIKLTGKVKLQLRVEVFNVLNTVNLFVNNDESMTWTPENVVFDTGNAATATKVISATPNGGFGQLSHATDPRQVQLGVKLSF